DRGAGFGGLAHDGVDLVSRRNVVADRELGRRRSGDAQARVPRDALARPEREPEIRLEIEERDCPELELLANDAVGVEAEAIAIEAHRTIEIVNADRQHADSWLHAALLPWRRGSAPRSRGSTAAHAWGRPGAGRLRHDAAEARRVVDAALARVARDLRVRAKRARPHDLVA